MYIERRSAVAGAVSWRSSGPGAARVLPDGCLDLLWYDEQLVVAGPDTRAFVSPLPAGGVTGLRFAPGVGPSVFGLPAHLLRDRRVALDGLWPAAEVRRLSEQVAEAVDRRAALESIAGRRLAEHPPDPMMRGVSALLATGASVAEVARHVALSERQLYRRSVVAFGYGPKTLARILRLGRALALARSGLAITDCEPGSRTRPIWPARSAA